MQKNLIGLIYDAALKPERWPELLESLAQTLEKQKTLADSEHLVVADKSEVFLSELIGEVVNAIYAESDSDLINHFGQALTIAERINSLSEQRNSLISLIDRLPSGVLLVDEKSQVSVKNRQASIILQQFHGITSVDGNIVCQFHDDTKVLHKIVAELSKPKALLASARGMTIRTKSSEEGAINVSFVPLRHSSFSSYGLLDVTVALFINSDKSKKPVQTSALKDVYGLTTAESTVLEKLVVGGSINDIADLLSISVHTVRHHVKQLLIKTNTHRQGELIGKVLSDPVNIMGEPIILLTQEHQLFDVAATLATPESMECERLLLPDGRFLSYKEYGDKEGDPVFFCHSAKGSRFQVPPIDDLLQRSRIRLIVPDRPGFGLSDPLPNRTMCSWPADLVALADKLLI